MKIQTLILRHFRLFELASLSFDPGLNYFSGPNAAGKTTLLEALVLLCTGKSMRTRHLNQLVKEGEERLALSCTFERHSIEQQIDLYSDGKKHELTINATRGHRLHALLGLCQGVVITPEDISIIKGGPEERRRFLDQHLCTTNPLYVHHLHRYRRALKQRAILLKKKAFSTIGIWEHELAKSAAFITEERATATAILEKEAAPLLRHLSKETERLAMRYKMPKNSELESYYIEALKKSRERDAILQTTTVGPHRDDLLITINDKPARAFASEGQKKSLICSLRLAEWIETKEKSGEVPFLGIDDIGACLDKERLAALTSEVSNLGAQVFVTAPSPPDNEGTGYFELAGGKIAASQIFA